MIYWNLKHFTFGNLHHLWSLECRKVFPRHPNLFDYSVHFLFDAQLADLLWKDKITFTLDVIEELPYFLFILVTFVCPR